MIAGRRDIRTQTSSETRIRRPANAALGGSGTHTAGTAVLQGWVRVVLGLAVAMFGIVFMFVGPS